MISVLVLNTMLRYLIIPLTLYPTALAGPIVVGDEELSRLVARVDCDFTSYHEPDKVRLF